MSATRAKSLPRPPDGLVAARFDIGGDAFALFEWPFEWPVAPRDVDSTLTRTEREVLALVLAGLPNAEIARRRGRSPRTVANQVASVFRHLGVRSRLELFASPRRNTDSPEGADP